MPGAGTYFRVAGMDRLFRSLTSLVEGAKAEEDWWVGTVVTYSAFLEWGTKYMAPRPFFQPAILRVYRRFREKGRPVTATTIAKRTNGQALWGLLVGDERGLAARVAFALEREVKVVIREKHLIDTGNLRASIVAAPSLPLMRKKSLASVPMFTWTGTRMIDRADFTNAEI